MQRTQLSAVRDQIATYSTIFNACGLFRNIHATHRSVIAAVERLYTTNTPDLPVDLAVFTS